jgi:hypothetical protein
MTMTRRSLVRRVWAKQLMPGIKESGILKAHFEHDVHFKNDNLHGDDLLSALSLSGN